MRTGANDNFLVCKVLIQLVTHWFFDDNSDIGSVNPQTYFLWMLHYHV